MRAFLIKRLLALIPTILFATLIVFIVIRLIPGDVIDQMVSQHDIGSQEVSRKSLEKALGLDVPIYVQYFRWMGRIFLHADLGS
ncbi:MAG: glutathione ABC transporter permease GsiC, partial [Deltaproteobacteria bacterium]|nr:glutathione ABC transporter permease GsiC [Deltaproteobacteria bacterium]